MILKKSGETPSRKNGLERRYLFGVFSCFIYMIYHHIAYCVSLQFHIVFLLFCPDPVLGQVFNISDSRLGFLRSPLISDLLNTNTFLVPLPQNAFIANTDRKYETQVQYNSFTKYETQGQHIRGTKYETQVEYNTGTKYETRTDMLTTPFR